MNLSDEARAHSELQRALATGRAEFVAESAQANVWPLICAHYPMLIAAIESLPSRVLERYPVLRAFHPMTAVLARTSRPFKPLIYSDEARSMSPDELDMLTLVQMVSFRFSGDVAAALIYARRLDERIQQDRPDSREHVDGPLWYFHHEIGSTYLAAGAAGRALLSFATARQLGALARQQDAERLPLGRAALAHAVRGSLDDTEAALQEVARQPEPTHAHVRPAESTERAAAALVAVDRLDPDLDSRLAVLEPYDSIELAWPFALLARARAMIAQHRPDDALEAVRLAREAHPSLHGAFASDVIAAMLIEAHCANGELRLAQRAAETGAATGHLTQLAKIRLAVLTSRWDYAGGALRNLQADRALGPGGRAELAVLAGWMDVAQVGRLERATALHLAHLARQRNTRRVFASAPRELVAAMIDALPPTERARTASSLSDLSHAELETTPHLTRSELRVLQGLSVHDTTASLAATFHVSPNTVKSQLRSVYRKLGCSSRAEALRVAARLNLLAPEDIAAGSPGEW
ncbi:hypothetical protein GCM10022200_26520 [Microbacterium awajiense]|uniref:HTH luxR-type domain-containing protein n=1 Tax=Microbacterium awajiense TaxID=415214 RepID=A0ABP7AVA4_9MICO